MYYGRCWLCGRWGWLEEHHIFGGANRKKSEKYGLKVGLCGDTCHRNGKDAAHQSAVTALQLHVPLRVLCEEQVSMLRSLPASVQDLDDPLGGDPLSEQVRH